MGSVPALNPPQQIDAGKLVQLKNLIQAAPLEMQQRQQAVQGGALDIQEKQRQLAREDAINKAYTAAFTNDPSTGAPKLDENKFMSAAAASGWGSAAQPVLEHLATYHKTLNENAELRQKLNAGERDEAGSVGYALQQSKYDPHLAKALIGQRLNDPSLDPQHQQTYAQASQAIDQGLAQGDDQARQVVQKIADPMVAGSEKYSKLQIEGITAQARKLGSETSAKRFQAELPGGELESPDKASMQDWLKKNPSRGPSDYTAWKAKQSPAFILAANQLRGDALDQNAENYFQTGKLPAGLSRSPGTTTAIINRAAQLHPGESLAASSEAFKANQQSLNSLQKNFDQVSAFENTAIRNLDLFSQKMKAIPDLGSRFANTPLRLITGKMIGDDKMAALSAARQTAAAEAAKVLSSANASGVLSDSQKKEALEVLDGNATYKATLATIDTLKQDFSNRHQSYAQQIADIKKRTGGGTQQGVAQPSAPLSITLPSGKKIRIE